MASRPERQPEKAGITMANYLDDNPDLQYYLEQGIDWDPLVRLTEQYFTLDGGFESTEEAVGFYKDIINLVADFAANEIAPRSKDIDRLGLRFESGKVLFPEPLNEIFEQIKALELHGACIPRELGGMNCPLMLYYINAELIARADVSVMAHHSFHGGIAAALLMYSILEGTTEYRTDPPGIAKTRFANEIAEIIRGDAWGSMDITEPNAGSDMAALRCTGEVDDEGRWFLTGQKILITSGHGKYHLVVARTEKTDAADDFAGLKGLSLFLAPIHGTAADGTRVDYASVDNLESKLGHHGSATVSISYERTPAHLIGKRGDGFKQMLLLMNTARIGVGFESLGLCEAAWRMAKAYAAERPSMGKTIDRHEMIADYLDEMENDIKGIRALAMYAAFHEEMAQKLQFNLLLSPPDDPDDRAAMERSRRRHQKRSRAVTPLLKYHAAEKAVEMARRAIQILGGGGYTTDYGAEKLLRDAIVFPIYEGTSQIQALMAMKDNLMEIVKDPKGFLAKSARAHKLALSGRDPLERQVARLRASCCRVLQHLMTRIVAAKFKEVRQVPITDWPRAFTRGWDPKRDFSIAMLHAERLTRMLADTAVAEALLEQARHDASRRPILANHLERATPRVAFLAEVISTTGDTLLKELAKTDKT